MIEGIEPNIRSICNFVYNDAREQSQIEKMQKAESLAMHAAHGENGNIILTSQQPPL